MTDRIAARSERIIVRFGGGGFGCHSFACFDKTQHRGVVVLSTADDCSWSLGSFLLESEWQSDRRPTETNINSQVYGSYVGQYERSPDFALRMFMMRQFFSTRPKRPFISRRASASRCYWSSSGAPAVPASAGLSWAARSWSVVFWRHSLHWCRVTWFACVSSAASVFAVKGIVSSPKSQDCH